MEYVVCRHGAPHELLSDRGANFLSELVAEVCKLFDVNTTTRKLMACVSGLTALSFRCWQRQLSALVLTSICRMFCMLTVFRYKSLLGSHLSFCFTVETQC